MVDFLAAFYLVWCVPCALSLSVCDYRIRLVSEGLEQGPTPQDSRQSVAVQNILLAPNMPRKYFNRWPSSAVEMIDSRLFLHPLVHPLLHVNSSQCNPGMRRWGEASQTADIDQMSRSCLSLDGDDKRALLLLLLGKIRKGGRHRNSESVGYYRTLAAPPSPTRRKTAAGTTATASRQRETSAASDGNTLLEERKKKRKAGEMFLLKTTSGAEGCGPLTSRANQLTRMD